MKLIVYPNALWARVHSYQNQNIQKQEYAKLAPTCIKIAKNAIARDALKPKVASTLETQMVLIQIKLKLIRTMKMRIVMKPMRIQTTTLTNKLIKLIEEMIINRIKMLAGAVIYSLDALNALNKRASLVTKICCFLTINV